MCDLVLDCASDVHSLHDVSSCHVYMLLEKAELHILPHINSRFLLRKYTISTHCFFENHRPFIYCPFKHSSHHSHTEISIHKNENILDQLHTVKQ